MEKLLTLREVLELIRVAYSTLRRWMNSKKFPKSVNCRGKLLWTQSSIESWMFQQSESASAPVITTPKQRRQADTAYQAARATLERHRIGKVE